MQLIFIQPRRCGAFDQLRQLHRGQLRPQSRGFIKSWQLLILDQVDHGSPVVVLVLSSLELLFAYACCPRSPEQLRKLELGELRAESSDPVAVTAGITPARQDQLDNGTLMVVLVLSVVKLLFADANGARTLF